jgi:hypothetical protein
VDDQALANLLIRILKLADFVVRVFYDDLSEPARRQLKIRRRIDPSCISNLYPDT